SLNGGANDAGFEDQVVFMDQGSAARSYTLRADQFLARTGSAMIGYAGMERLTLNAGNFNDSVGVLATVPGMPVTLNMRGGNHVVTIGTPTTASLNSISAPVTVNGDAGNDVVVLNDQTNRFVGFYGITDAAVNYGILQARLLNYETVEGLTVNGTANDDIAW